MNILIAAIGLVVLVFAAWAAASPDSFKALIRRILDAGHFYTLAGLRLAIGVVFIYFAEATRWPVATIAIGAMFVLAAAAIPAMGRARIQHYSEWWLAQPDTVFRVWAVAAGAFGAFIIWLGA